MKTINDLFLSIALEAHTMGIDHAQKRDTDIFDKLEPMIAQKIKKYSNHCQCDMKTKYLGDGCQYCNIGKAVVIFRFNGGQNDYL